MNLRLKIIDYPLYGSRYYIPQRKFLWFWCDLQDTPFYNYEHAIVWLEYYKKPTVTTYEYF